MSIYDPVKDYLRQGMIFDSLKGRVLKGICIDYLRGGNDGFVFRRLLNDIGRQTGLTRAQIIIGARNELLAEWGESMGLCSRIAEKVFKRLRRPTSEDRSNRRIFEKTCGNGLN